MAKKEEKQKVKCHDCKHAVLQQWDNNPVIAFCNEHKSRDVAMTPRLCSEYKERKGEPKVQKLTHFR